VVDQTDEATSRSLRGDVADGQA
ncbi:hypothetical protein Q604_UNBC02931G0002, partial [human gut metagenome]